MAQTNLSEPIYPVIRKLFKGLKLIYPFFCRGLTERETNATMRLWTAHLGKYSDERILQILADCPKAYPSKAPLVSEFRNLCKTRPEHTDYVHREPLKLEMLSASDVMRKEAMAKIAKLLGKVTITTKAEPQEYTPMTAEAEQERREFLHDQVRQSIEDKQS